MTFELTSPEMERSRSGAYLRTLHPVNPVNPFLVDQPCLLSFSGGRTSAMMLWRVLQSYGGVGKLPRHIHVAYANTGKERPETLRFIHEVSDRWLVPITWLEWRPLVRMPGDLVDPDPRQFDEVGPNSCSRLGEPFEAIIRRKQFLPNKMARFCTTALKVKTMQRWMRSLGHDHWFNMVGLRADEKPRVLRQLLRNESKKERFTSIMPLASAMITVRDVAAFWAKQPFDLGLKPHEGNCDLCFLKGERKLMQIMRDEPGISDWWRGLDGAPGLDSKVPDGAFFSTRFRYGDLQHAVDIQHELDGITDEDDGECGVACASEGFDDAEGL